MEDKKEDTKTMYQTAKQYIKETIHQAKDYITGKKNET